jgi:GWxTD domain-containing protein
VALLESCLTDTPVLIGYLRPVVLLPLGCLAGLSTAQVECILLHELAHVARHDYLVNLLQSVVEGLLFYHPAVWWVSHVIRTERENCCDDRVVELTGNARVYAATLATLEQRRALAPALAATDGNLMKRIRRLTKEPGATPPTSAPGISAGVLLVMCAAALSAVPAKAPPAAPVPVPVQATTPYKTWLNEDVAYIITDEERSAFLRLHADNEREKFIANFWAQRGEPMKEEHYRRIAFSNEHFGADIPGWQTDRGRIYITYGPPDEIEDHSGGGKYQRSAAEGGGETSTYPFQRWIYRHIDGVGDNVEIEFVDATRSGDFHMTHDPREKELPTPHQKWLNEDAAYIVTHEERGVFNRLDTDKQREQFIENFWAQRGGNGFREEHYRRIAFSNEHFGTGIPGWKTDRGRIYITYGPPDQIEDQGKIQDWTYRHLDGFGDNVVVEFEDRDGSGEFRMTKAPGEKKAAYRGNGARQVVGKPQQEANVLASTGSPTVSVIVAGGGVIGPGDVLDIAYAPARVRDPADPSLDPATELKRSECAELQKRYSPAHPAVVDCTNQIRVLEQNVIFDHAVERKQTECVDLQKKYTPAFPAVAECANQLRAIEQRAIYQYTRSGASQTARANSRQETRVTVPPDGQIAINTFTAFTDGRIVGHVGTFAAAGLTPDQLAAVIGRNATVRVEQAAPRMVTVLAPLANTRDRFHVVGQVFANQKSVQSFDTESTGGNRVASVITLSPGAYHLTVAVTNLTNGASETQTRDFTVE